MKVVAVRSTITLERPASIGSDMRCLNSGAVNRSISPVTATTWVSSSMRRSLISKSMAIDLVVIRGRCRFESSPVGVGEPDVQELSLPFRGDGKLVGELLDHVADARHGSVDDQGLASALAQRADAEQQ